MKTNHIRQQSRAGPRTNGFTIVELLVVMAIIGIVGSLALYGLRGLGPRAIDAAGQVGGTVKQVRAKAMATTSFYRLVSESGRALRTEWTIAEDGCDETDADAWTDDVRLRIELEDQFRILQANGNLFGNDETIICFNPRGLGDTNPTMVVADTQRGNSASVEVLIGGSVEIQ